MWRQWPRCVKRQGLLFWFTDYYQRQPNSRPNVLRQKSCEPHNLAVIKKYDMPTYRTFVLEGSITDQYLAASCAQRTSIIMGIRWNM